MWLTGRPAPDHKTIADFRKDNGPAIKKVCARFIALCRKMGLLTKASVAIDGSKFKAVNSRDNNFTQGKIQRRQCLNICFMVFNCMSLLIVSGPVTQLRTL
jgi:transposase